MPSTYSNLGIELIASGDQAGTWGTTTNTNLGTLIDQAIAGYEIYTCTGGTDTITIPNGASGVARNMTLQLNGTGGGNLVVPTNEKLYFIFNNTSAAITVKVTTGVSVPAGAKTVLVCNGTDVLTAQNYLASLTLGAALPVASGGTSLTTLTANNVLLGNGTSAPQFVAPTTSGNILTANGTTWVSSTPATNGTVTSVAVSGGSTGLTTSGGPITSTGTITLAGTLAVANGGTGATSTTAYAVYTGNSAGTGFTPIAPSASGNLLTSNGTNWASTAPTAVTTFSAGTTGLTPSTGTSGAVSLAGTLVVANGGTGAATIAENNVILGNGTSAVQVVAPSTSGNVLTSNGTTWTSAAGNFASGTIMLFAQTAAPTGWTKLVARDNYAIRVVTGTAGNNDAGVGFTTAFASQSVAGTVGGTSITTAQLPTAAIFVSGANADQGATGSTGRGSGDTHTHSFTGTAINLATNYVDVIQASKN